jgi:hypothetical protein
MHGGLNKYRVTPTPKKEGDRVICEIPSRGCFLPNGKIKTDQPTEIHGSGTKGKTNKSTAINATQLSQEDDALKKKTLSLDSLRKALLDSRPKSSSKKKKINRGIVFA